VTNYFSTTADITGPPVGTGTSNLITTAYDTMVGFALRSEPIFRSLIDKRPASVSHAGAVVRMQKYADLTAVSSTLTENVDPDSVAIGNTSYVDITLGEYGNSVLVTEKLALESLSAIDPAVANLVAFNMRDSLDGLVLTEMRSNLRRVKNIAGTLTAHTNGTATITGIDAADKITSAYVRYVVSKLRASSAQSFDGGKFLGYVHPDVSHDLRAETGAAAWRDIHNYSGANSVWAGEIGEYEGVRFVESPRVYQDLTGGEASAKVSSSFIMGREALVEAVGREPGVVVGNVTDKLLRFRPIGWKALLGWQIYREEAIWQIHTGTTY
jgi:N4-gp56 family major capsid protein